MILYFQQKRKTEMLSARLPSLFSDIEKGAFYEQRKTCVCRKETCLCSKSKGTETNPYTPFIMVCKVVHIKPDAILLLLLIFLIFIYSIFSIKI